MWGGCERAWLCVLGWVLPERWPGDEPKDEHASDDQDSRGVCSQVQPSHKR